MRSTAESIVPAGLKLGVLGATAQLSVFNDKAIFFPRFDHHGYRMLSRVKSSIILTRGTMCKYHKHIELYSQNNAAKEDVGL